MTYSTYRKLGQLISEVVLSTQSAAQQETGTKTFQRGERSKTSSKQFQAGKSPAQKAAEELKTKRDLGQKSSTNI